MTSRVSPGRPPLGNKPDGDTKSTESENGAIFTLPEPGSSDQQGGSRRAQHPLAPGTSKVVVIERPLEPGERAEVTMEYAGGIDEEVYQVNLPDEEFFSPVSYTMHIEEFGEAVGFRCREISRCWYRK